MLEKNEMIFGVRAVIEAIQAGREIDKVLVPLAPVITTESPGVPSAS